MANTVFRHRGRRVADLVLGGYDALRILLACCHFGPEISELKRLDLVCHFWLRKRRCDSTTIEVLLYFSHSP